MASVLSDHSEMLGSATILGRVVVVEGFPALVASADGARVEGDVLRLLDDSVLRHVDEYEGGDYARELREVVLASGERVEAWVYVLAEETRTRARLPGAAGW